MTQTKQVTVAACDACVAGYLCSSSGSKAAALGLIPTFTISLINMLHNEVLKPGFKNTF
jgi:hypothetical protein